MKIAIVGASGFIGKALIDDLLEGSSHDIIAISRSRIVHEHPRFSWRGCDLHNLKELETALHGADAAVYLVHSMLPGARLNQGTFADFDLSLADNFARTAKFRGINHVIYLSGLMPDSEKISDHLRCRKEVEDAFRSYIPELTCLRAGVIIGPQGSSFRIMVRLVERLPVMLCPSWAQHKTQAVSLKDVIHVLGYCLEHPETKQKIYDLGAEPPITYQEMLQKTAEIMGKHIPVIGLPITSVKLSKLWVRLISGAPKDLVYPLVESLREPMLVRPSHRFEEKGWRFTPFEEAVREVLTQSKDTGDYHLPHAFRVFRLKEKSVRSIQRLKLPKGRNAAWVAIQYVEYLPKIFPLLIRVVRDGNLIFLKLRALPLTLLILDYSPDRSSTDRQLFYVKGGLLSRRTSGKARLKLRETLGGEYCLAAVHDFRPRLPWIFYRLTQAVIHAWFMARLGNYIKKR